ncbi:MAG: hypothetical protein A2Z25_22415 [Planctomycetes bacterium RBG_16_55_9]|nr:MAG: hypothetical protein A2Z25_22415 [Planctomycetes bacterium RBG_16_55_9]
MCVLFCLAVAAILFVGWRLRMADLIAAEHGLGHVLGIVGASLMALLMIYPARKRIPALRVIGSVKMWFCIHMMLGVLGPVCILFHAGFRLGSVNSSVALFLMLAIAASGILGRYAYCKIHDGLYGRRITLLELSDRLNNEKEEVRKQFAPVPGIKEELLSVAAEALQPCTSLSESIRRLFSVRYRSILAPWRVRRLANAHLKNDAVRRGWTRMMKAAVRRRLKLQAELFLEQTVDFAQFAFFERLFALWQVLHIPSSCILAFVVLVHVLAASLY